jgi:hypothetical protein
MQYVERVALKIPEKPKYTQEYLDDDNNYFTIGNVQYLLDISVEKNGRYTRDDLAKEPFDDKPIPRTNAVLVPGHFDVFDVILLHYQTSYYNKYEHPITQEPFTEDQKAFIKNKYFEVVFKDQKVHYDIINDDFEFVEFLDSLLENDIIILKNHKAVYLADAYILRGPRMHRVIHCKYREDSDNIFILKLSTIKGYVSQNDAEYATYKSKISKSYKSVTPSNRLLLIDSYYTMQTIANIISHFKFINFYGGKQYYGQIEITPDILQIIHFMRNKERLNQLALLNKIPHPTYTTKMKLSNIRRPLADPSVTNRYQMFSRKSPSSLKTLSPISISSSSLSTGSPNSVKSSSSSQSKKSSSSPSSVRSSSSAQSKRSSRNSRTRRSAQSARAARSTSSSSSTSSASSSRSPMGAATRQPRRRT